MADTVTKEAPETGADTEVISRVYEVGYHIVPTVSEENLESEVANIRAVIDKANGSLIAEGAPQSIKLAYPMDINRGGKHDWYDKAYFGWIKFEIDPSQVEAVNRAFEQNENILRHLIFKTVREETRAAVRQSVLREVRRTDTIKSTPKRGSTTEEGGEVSEEALEKSIEELTSDESSADKKE